MMASEDENVADATHRVTTTTMNGVDVGATSTTTHQQSIIALTTPTADTTKATSLLKRETAAESKLRNFIIALIITCSVVALVVLLVSIFSRPNDSNHLLDAARSPAAPQDSTTTAGTPAIQQTAGTPAVQQTITPPVAVPKATTTGVGAVSPTNLSTQPFNSPPASNIPVSGLSATLMSQKAHGTCLAHVMPRMRWNINEKKSDEICCFNRDWAEYSGYWKTTSFLADASTHSDAEPMDFFDSVTGDLLFRAPIGRTWAQFLAESTRHGWPSFRDAEVNWNKVRTLQNGETVSVSGTHLGHNLPDDRNRYCINLISVSGRDTNGGGVTAANK